MLSDGVYDMPLFEYICRECGKAFEKIVSLKAKVTCPDCGTEAVDKQLSAFAVSKSDSASIPECSSSGCGFERGGCGSGMCGGGLPDRHHG